MDVFKLRFGVRSRVWVRRIGHTRPFGLVTICRIARKKGGTDHLENLQLLCGHCNSVKGDRGMEYLRAKLQLAA
ncbi:MAG: HNH endonuclease [Acidimicrobiia bacterium]|nr:HNH endonuclease [Acidimicrobiia bacterium]